MHEILATFPTLRDAVQPRDLQPATGSGSLEPAKLFEQPLQLRCPVDDASGLAGPFLHNGHCLVPWTEPGCISWVDPTIEPVDGDLVIVLLSQAQINKIVARNRPACAVSRYDRAHGGDQAMRATANCPAGCGWKAGRYDPDRHRVDLSSGEVVAL
jgi:hypothetical protein